MTPTAHRCAAERTAVTEALRATGEVWTTNPPNYQRSSRPDLSKRLEQIRDAVLVETNAPRHDIEKAYEQSQAFIDTAFDLYEGRQDLGRKIARAFLVPMRSDRTDERYASESLTFYPLLDPNRFAVSSDIRMRAMYGLPPTVLDTYLKSNDPNETGALILAPLYTDMQPDIWSDPTDITQAVQLSSTVDAILEDTVRFAHHRLGADYLGLGATLPHPNLTDFGRKIRLIPGIQTVTTTTGHGGTVAMIIETLRNVLAQSHNDFGGRIGILGGAGSIGWSTILAIRHLMPELTIHTYDARRDRMRRLLGAATELNRVIPAESTAEILSANTLVISAITDVIDLDHPAYADIPLYSTVWIDDSQPGSVDRQQLQARGGTVIWVAGQDNSATKFMTRDGYHSGGTPYDYGSVSGLYGATTEFACGLEAAVVAASHDPSNAVSAPVTFEDVERIGKLFSHYGVDAAPFQSYGQPVQFRQSHHRPSTTAVLAW